MRDNLTDSNIQLLGVEEENEGNRKEEILEEKLQGVFRN